MNEKVNSNDSFDTPRRQEIILVVPCFNEESRLDKDYWGEILGIEKLTIYFVDDGSSDETFNLLNEIVSDSHHRIYRLIRNVGKAEAVRFGLIQAFMETPAGVGFIDSDGAFPIRDVRSHILKFQELNQSQIEPPAVWSSRVQLAGRNIERRNSRHYISRILMTLLALKLKFKIYDTQSGFKIFPHSDTLEKCLQTEFLTRWFIDLELFLRWRRITGKDLLIWEEPLQAWNDVNESKLKGRQHLIVLRDLQKLINY
jgi:glycosyltransferase involved in cell wall biosynthesis